MTTDQCVAIFSAVVSFAGLLLVALQLNEANKRSKLESQIALYDITRKLVSLGFSHPQLFEILKDAQGVDPVVEQRYLQLWLNQLSLIHTFKETDNFRKDVQESFDRDLRDVVTQANMRRHWQQFEKYYPASFQKAVNGILDEAGLGASVVEAKS